MGRGGNRSKGESGDDEKEDADDEDGEKGGRGRGRGRFRRYRPRYVRRGGKPGGDEEGHGTSGDEADREVSCNCNTFVELLA